MFDHNALVRESADETNDSGFDLDGDGLVDRTDVNIWARELKNTWLRDADLNGEFNSTDMIAVFQAGQYEGDQDANWTEGDWTGDYRFDTADLVGAFQDGGYGQGPRAEANAVPETTSFAVVMAALVAFATGRRQCGPRRRLD